MPNKVYVDYNGFLTQKYSGLQTGRSVALVVSQSRQIITVLRKQHRPVLIIVDLSKITGTTADSRRQSALALRNMDYDKIALFGASLYIKHLANFVIKASGVRKKIRVFDSKKEAHEWLKK